MATLNVTELRDLAKDSKGNILPIAHMPAIRSENVTYTTSSQGTAFSKSTRFLRVVSDAVAHIEIDANPTATSSSTKLEAGQAEYFGVDGTKNLKIAAYDGSS